MVKYYNKITFKEEIERRMGVSWSYVSFWKYEVKGFIKPSGYMANGKREVPIYTEREIVAFIKRMPQLKLEGKIRKKHVEIS